MVSPETQAEIEESFGQVPSWIESLSDSAADHSWAVVRDLQFGDTELESREKALVAYGAASAMNCNYCIHFHGQEAMLEGVSETGMREAANVAATVRYFSTILHGAETDLDEFKRETGEIVDHIERQQSTPAAGAD